MKNHPLAHASRVTAHEAGHVVVAWYCKTVVEVKVDLTDSHNYMTAVRGVSPADPAAPPNRATILATWEHIAYALGGMAAETIVLGSEPNLPDNAKDIVAAFTSAKLLRRWRAAKCPWTTLDESVDLNYFSRLCQLPNLGMRERLILRNGFAYARYLVSQSPREIAALRSLLLDRQKAEWNEVQAIFGPRPWAVPHP
jgi:hypothetical protein